MARIAKHGTLVLVVATIAVASLVRLRLADVPLERDEGEYAYAGQLILRGVPPYLKAYNMKFPGSYYAYALIMGVFGQTPRGIRLGLMLVNAEHPAGGREAQREHQSSFVLHADMRDQ